MFIGREKEMHCLEQLYAQDCFQMFVLYGRRRVGKTTLLKAFVKDKPALFYSAEQSNSKMNLERFSELVFAYYNEANIEAFSSWENAFKYIHHKTQNKRFVLVLDEFPYLVRKDRGLLSTLQHLIDHTLKESRLFIILCGSYMGFMEKEVLGAKSPIFGRRTGQLQLKPFDYHTALSFTKKDAPQDALMLYGAFGGTPQYLSQINPHSSVEENIKNAFLRVTSYLYEEPLLLLYQEVQEPGVYSAIIEAIACGAVKTGEIASKTGEEASKCLKYIHTLISLGILYKENPYGEKPSSRKTIYGISDLMFRFWYRYVFPNRTLIETDAMEAVWQKRVANDFNRYMGLVFERICKEFLLRKNSTGSLPFLFSSIGRWWGTNNKTHIQEEIDIVAGDGENYLVGECKWRNEKVDLPIYLRLKEKADVFNTHRKETWYYLFSKSGFTDRLTQAAACDSHLKLVSLDDLVM